MTLAALTVAGHSFRWSTEGVFLGSLAIIWGIQIWVQKANVLHLITAALLGAFAMTSVPQFGAKVSEVSSQPWAQYGIPLALLGLVIYAAFLKKK